MSQDEAAGFRLGRPFRRDDGQAAFEFVLMFPIFIGLLLLIFDFGILMYEYVSVSNAAREGARYASVNCGDSSCTLTEIQNWTVARGGGILKASPTCTSPFGGPTTAAQADMICVNWVDPATGTARGATAAKKGDAVVLTVKHRYGFLFLPAVNFPVVSCAVMRLERDDTATTGVGPVAC
jgi:hypothetical protein